VGEREKCIRIIIFVLGSLWGGTENICVTIIPGHQRHTHARSHARNVRRRAVGMVCAIDSLHGHPGSLPHALIIIFRGPPRYCHLVLSQFLGLVTASAGGVVVLVAVVVVDDSGGPWRYCTVVIGRAVRREEQRAKNSGI
jgi:hypothetical protein